MLIASSTPVLAAAAAADALEPSAAQALGVVEYAFFIGAEFTGAVLLFATGVLAIRTRVLPAWLGWASLVVALLMLIVVGPIGFIAIVVGLPLWVLVVSVLLWRRRVV
jgi:anti-sigma factor RsiW